MSDQKLFYYNSQSKLLSNATLTQTVAGEHEGKERSTRRNGVSQETREVVLPYKEAQFTLVYT